MPRIDPDAVDLVLALVGAGRPVVAPTRVDWKRFVGLLSLHGIQGLAAATHRSSPFLPREVAGALEEPYLRTALHTTLTLEAGSRAWRALNDGGIPALLFKGAALVESGLYVDPGARAMGDADVLVRPEQADAAVAALGEADFQPWSDWDPVSVEWLDSASFTDRSSPDGVEVSLDLHWRLGYGRLRYGPSERSGILWEGADLDRGRPDDSAHLTVLLEHLLKHLHVTTHLRGIGDVVRLSERIDDWSPIWRRLREQPTGRGMALLLDVLRIGLDARVPSEVARYAEAGAWRDAGRSALDLRRMVTTGCRDLEAALRIGEEERGVEGVEGVEGAEGGGRLKGLGRRWAVLGSPRLALREAAHAALPERGWLRARYGEPAATRLRLLLRYWVDLARWITGRGRSPVSPNQELW